MDQPHSSSEENNGSLRLFLDPKDLDRNAERNQY